VQAIEPGFDPSNTLALRLSLPKSGYKDREVVTRFADLLQSRIQSLPGVEAVAAINALPMSNNRHIVDVNFVGRALTPGDAYTAQYGLATPDYFRAMKIPLLQGRSIESRDTPSSVPVVVINETMARRFWPNESPIGTRINIDDNNVGPRPFEIVGVVGNVKHFSLEEGPTFDVYLPMSQIHEDALGSVTNNHYWIVRSKIDSAALGAAFLCELRNIDWEVATSNVKTLDDYLAESVGPRKFNLRVLTIFSVAALLLAATGIYGVVSYSVKQRTQEIGIRLALGAGRVNIFRMILAQGLKVVVAGVAVGALGAFAMMRVIRCLLFGVTPTDTITFIVVSLMLVLIALIACSAPARRATRVDPLIALRNE
jgi:putative ABC transport system permease protein